MALDSELLNLKSAGTYRFERDLSTISNETSTFSNLRMVVGFSKIGPFNTPNLITSTVDFIKLYGNIDRSLEKKGSYFHRSCLVALSAGPILALNLLNLDPDRDQVQTKTFSVNIQHLNKYTTTLPLNSLYNTDKFWYASEESFLDAIDNYMYSSSDTTMDSGDGLDNDIWSEGGLLHFANISKKPLSILIKKASSYNSKGFELTLNEWYGEDSVPEYLNGTSYVSDYLVEVYIVSGDFGPALYTTSTTLSQTYDADGDGAEALKWSRPYEEDESAEYYANPYKRFTSDVVYQSYFDENGFIRKLNTTDKTDTRLTKFLNLPSVNLVAKYVGSLIPNFVDKLGRNIWIQKLINDDIDTVGVLCAEDTSMIESVSTDADGYINEAIDIIGHNAFDKIVSYKNEEYNEDDISLDIDTIGYKYRIEDSFQEIQIERQVLVDGTGSTFNGNIDDSDSDTTNDSSDFSIITETQTFVRIYNDAYDKDGVVTDTNGEIKYPHPYAWLRKKDDGTVVIPTGTSSEEDIIWTDSNYIADDSVAHYAYDTADAEDDDDSRHIIVNATHANSIIVEHTSYDQDEDLYFVTSKGDTYDADYAYNPQDNECIVSSGTGIIKGSYILSHWFNGYNGDSDSSSEDRFSRITRVITTKPIYAFKKDEDDEYVKVNTNYVRVVCADKIWRTARKIANNTIVQIKTLDEVCDRLHWVCLNGFKLSDESIPDGTNERQNDILDMIRENPEYSSTTSNLFKALIDRDYIQWRYLVDSFGLGLEESCKDVYTQLCQSRKSALAIINCPSQLDFKKSTDPSFLNKAGGVDVEYIAEGGNPEKNPLFLFTLPEIEDGASWGAYYYPYLRISDLSAVKSVPPAAYVSNLYIQKYTRANAWSIVAGQKRGVISGNQVIGVEATLIHENRDYLEPVGINSIIWENGVGVEIYANKTAKQTPKSALSSIHVRECCIYIQDNIESILRRYVFEYNTAQTRLEIKTLVDEFLEGVKNNSGIYEYKTVMDTTNNTQEVIDNNMGIIDVYIEPVRGLEILTQRLTVMKTGGIASASFE